MASKRASYRQGVAWIAEEDEPSVTDSEQVADMISVSLLADLFAKDAEKVAADVVRFRVKLSESLELP